MTELHYLSLFVRAIVKVLLMTGLGMGGALALLAECCGFRVVALGIEKVSERAVSRDTSIAIGEGNQPAREVLEAA